MVCDAKTFRDSMVANYTKAAVGWANEYSPILDVTNTVKKVCPKVTRALLTIYGDDLSKIKAIKVGTVTPVLYPDGRPADISVYGEKAIWNILHNWLAGYEFERQTCEGVSYWVIYPCKLEVQGTLELPCVLSDFVSEDEVRDVTNIVSQYITQPKVTKATLTIYGSKPQGFVGIYDDMPDEYPDGRDATDVKNIVENWFMRQEWERIQCQRTGKWYWVVYPCELKIETEEVKTEKGFQFKVSPSNPDLGTTATVSWSHKNNWSRKYKFKTQFILVKPNGEQTTLKSYDYELYPGKTKTGSFTFTVPNLPGKYTLIGIVILYYGGEWTEDQRASYSWIVPGTEEPTANDFVNALVQHYGSKTPTIDVSKTLESRLPEDPEREPPKDYLDHAEPLFGIIDMRYADNNYGCCAKLTLHLERPEEIEVTEYGYDIPPKRYHWVGDFVSNVVKGWFEGYEMVRMYSPKSGKWYWVKIPCGFVYEFKKASPILQIDGTKGTITYGYKGAFYSLGDWGGSDAVLLINGEVVDKIDISYDDWKRSTTKEFKKTISIPPLTKGYHTVTVAYCSTSLKYGKGATTKQIYVVELPHASIIKDLSRYPDGLGGIIYNGQALEPNKEHLVSKGSEVDYLAFAQNIGGPGNIWIRLLVNGVEVDRAEGGSPAISGTITVNADMELKFEAGHGDVKDSEWGC